MFKNLSEFAPGEYVYRVSNIDSVICYQGTSRPEAKRIAEGLYGSTLTTYWAHRGQELSNGQRMAQWLSQEEF